MKTLTIHTSLIALLLLSFPSFAGYAKGKIKILNINTNGWVHVGMQSRPAKTCITHVKSHMKFDSRTEGGKALYSMLLAAKMSNLEVKVWYTNSPTPGATAKNCDAKMAILYNAGLEN